MRFSRALSAALIGGLFFTATAAATPVAVADDDCDPVAILAFRGSGEKNIDASATGLDGKPHEYTGTALQTNGWEGNTLKRMLQRFADATGTDWPAGFSPANVPVIGIGYDGSSGYPAIEVPKNKDLFRELIQSSNQGAKYALGEIRTFQRTQPAGCDTKFIAIGYSQGAMAARTLDGLTNDVVAVANLGDPWQKPNARGNDEGDGNAPYGEGVARAFLKTDDDRKKIDAYYTRDADPKTALCHENDPMCSYSWVGGPGLLVSGQIPAHLNYASTQAEATRKGSELANMAATLWATGDGGGEPTRAAMDVMFAIDTTGSMSPYIQAARDTALSAASSIFSSAKQGRVGLVEYRDHGDSFVARTVVPLTSSSDEFSAGLDALYPDEGGDLPEALISGVYEAARAGWNPEASKSLIVIADAPAHDPEPVTGYTLAQMGEVLAGRIAVPPAPSAARMFSAPGEDRSQDPSESAPTPPTAEQPETSDETERVVLDAEATGSLSTGTSIALYGISADAALADQLTGVANATGGKVTAIDNADEVREIILDAIEDASAAPEAVVAASDPQVTGVSVAFSAADSTADGGVASYEFDLDGDGTFDQAGSSAVVEFTYATPGPRNVVVRVSDSRGRTATATVVVDVSDQTTSVVTPVDPSAQSSALTNVTLSSSVTTPRSPATLTVADVLETNERVGVRLVPSGSTTPWEETPVATYEVLRTEDGTATSSIVPSAELPVGMYELLVVTDAGRHASLEIEVANDQARIVEIPSAPAITDPAGPGNASWVVPEGDDTFRWTLGADGSLRVDIVATDATFPDGSTSHNFGRAVDSTPDAQVVVPTPPTRSGNTVHIPAQQGVVFKDARGRVLAGAVPVPRGGLVVKASAVAGFVLDAEATSSWSYSYESKPRPAANWWRVIVDWFSRILR